MDDQERSVGVGHRMPSMFFNFVKPSIHMSERSIIHRHALFRWLPERLLVTDSAIGAGGRLPLLLGR